MPIKRNPQDYRCIAAWGLMLGSKQYYIEMEQQRAANDDAPLDAIYHKHDGGWGRLSEVNSESAIDFFKTRFPSLYNNYLKERTQDA